MTLIESKKPSGIHAFAQVCLVYSITLGIFTKYLGAFSGYHNITDKIVILLAMLSLVTCIFIIIKEYRHSGQILSVGGR